MKEKEKTPLKISLQNFLNHVELFESQRNEDTYEKEFQELKNFSEKLKTLKGYSCSEGENEVNRKKNRYKDILPFDSSRVKLTEYVGVPGSNYINANFIRGASGSPAYIASQGPLPHTVNDFWRMVVEWDVQVIVMACSVEEAGKHKCEKYWVDSDEEKQFGNVTVQLVNSSVVCPDYLVRTMLIKYPTSDSDSSTVERKVCQYHYVAWPDHGVPSKVRPLVDMVRKVRETQVSETLPVLVHCSAGCGRTGTICAIDYVWGLLRSGRLTKDFSLFNLVRKMRKQRIAMVQTKEQYILVHQAVRELFFDQLRVIDSHPYENIDVNGMPLVKDEEEPMYATVGCENLEEEKQDEKEKDTVREPNNQLPSSISKKRGYATFSKQEKEVENLTEKQRSAVEYSSESDSSALSVSLCNKPKVEILKALFELNSATKEHRSSQCRHKNHQQVTRSHSLGAICKFEKLQCAESLPVHNGEKSRPIPSQGTLHVPKLRAFQAKHALLGTKQSSPVKRSKSLKVLNSSDSYNLSVVPILNGSTRPRHFPGVGSQENISCIRKISGCSSTQLNSTRSASPLSLQVMSTGQIEENSFHNSESAPDKTLQSVNARVLADPGSCGTVKKNFCTSRRRSLDSITNTYECSSSETTPSTVPCDKKCEQLEREDAVVAVDRKLVSVVKPVRVSASTSGARKPSKMAEVMAKDSKIGYEATKEMRPSMKGDACRHPIFDSQKSVSSIAAGLAVRERRNSFHQAVNTNYEMTAKMKEYDPIWLRSTRQNSALNINVPLKANFGEVSQHMKLKQSSDGGESRGKTRKDQRHCPSSNIKVLSTKEILPLEYCKRFWTSANVSVDKSFERKHMQHCTHNPALANPNRGQRSIQFERSEPAVKYNLADVNSREAVVSQNNYWQQNVSSANMNGIVDSLQQPVLLQSKVDSTKGGSFSRDLKGNHDVAKLDVVKKECGQRKVHFSTEKSVQRKEYVQIYNSTPFISQVVRVSDQQKTRDCQHRTDGLEVLQKNCLRCSGAECSSASEAVSGNPGVDTLQQQQLQMESSMDVRHRYSSKCCCGEKVAAGSSVPEKHHTSDPDVVSYGLVAGVKFRQGSQDDMSLCACMPATSPRVRRHASIVLLRHSLIEMSDGAVAPLSVWKNHRQDDSNVRRVYNHSQCERKEAEARYTAKSLRSDGRSHSTGSAQERDDHMMQTRDDSQFAIPPWHTPSDAERVVNSVNNVKQGTQLKRQQYI